MNSNRCGARRSIESALAAHRLPFKIAVEVDAYEMQLSLASQGVGLALVLPQVLRVRVPKTAEVVKVADFLSEQAVWIVHASHIGRLAPVVRKRCVARLASLHLKADQPE